MIKVNLILKLGLISSLFLFVLHKEAPYIPLKKAHRTGEGVENFKKWKGTFHYKLNYSDDFFYGGVKFLEMKGLRGRNIEKIEVDGNITFAPAVGNRLYAGHGSITYAISIMSFSEMGGNASVMHMTNGKGSSKIKPLMNKFNEEIDDDKHKQKFIEYQTFIKFDYRNRTYNMRITPGDYEKDLDEFGVVVESSSRIRVTDAMIDKMNELERPILYPEALKSMFKDNDIQKSCENIVFEAFDKPFSPSSNVLKGSYKDTIKGGVLSWELKAY